MKENIHNIKYFIRKNKAEYLTRLFSSGSSSRSMNESLEFGRIIIMNNILNHWNINTSCCQISHNQYLNLLIFKSIDHFFSCQLIHLTIYPHRINVLFLKKITYQFYMIFSTAKYYHLFSL